MQIRTFQKSSKKEITADKNLQYSVNWHVHTDDRTTETLLGKDKQSVRGRDQVSP